MSDGAPGRARVAQVACAACGKKAWPGKEGALPPGWNLLAAKPTCRHCLVLASMLAEVADGPA